jgi:hypothetical protein
MRLKIISCNVMNHELRNCASRSINRIDTEFIHQGLHEYPDRLYSAVKEALNRVETELYDYILLNYGLCGNGTLNVSHPELSVIIHNVHDCIPLIIGDRKAHAEYTAEKPGTFWYSCGWIEGFPLPGGPDYDQKYRDFYGRSLTEKQRDIVEAMMMENYTDLIFLRWDELGERLMEWGRKYTKECVGSLSRRLRRTFEYDELKGSPDIIRRFVDGEWDSDDFLIIGPGKKLQFNALKSKLYVE